MKNRMKKHQYNKLVRDRIPNLLIKENKAFKASHVDLSAYKKALAEKLIEESGEVSECVKQFEYLSEMEPMDSDECNQHLAKITEELGDLLEVFIAISKTYNISATALLLVAFAKREKFGKFDDGIFLEWVEEEKEK